MAHNYDGITNASYMNDPAVRSWCEEQARAANPGADETTIHLHTERMFHQYPVVLMLAECEKRLDKALKEIETAQYRNTSQDKATAKELKTLTGEVKDLKGKLAERDEDVTRITKQRDGYENQYRSMMKAQKSGGQS